MQILLATRSLTMPGGSETYLETVAVELAQLGHEIIAYSPLLGTMAQRLREAGIDVRDDLTGLAPDVIHAQQASTAMRVRGRFPTTPMVYVCHSSVLDIEDPPVAANPQALVTLNDIVDKRARAGSIGQSVPVFRLTQPVTTPFIDPLRRQLPPNPRTAVLVSHRAGWIQDEIERACSAAGIDLTILGQADNRPDDPGPEMMKADLVFAVGRTLLEAMSMGRASFIADDRGLWGFITAENYADAETHAFARFSERPVIPLDHLLRSYDMALGDEMVRLTRVHHGARAHAANLVNVYTVAVNEVPFRQLDSSVAHNACADALEQCFTLSFAARDAKWQVAAAQYEIEVSRLDHQALIADRDRHSAALDDELTRVRAENAKLTTSLHALQRELDAWRNTRTVRLLQPLRSAYARIRSLVGISR